MPLCFSNESGQGASSCNKSLLDKVGRSLMTLVCEKRGQRSAGGSQTQVMSLSTEMLASLAREHPECPAYGYELFRRALVGQSDEAWTCVYQLYQSHVLTWIWKSRGGKVLLDE